jgi:hypothetical protein
VLADSMSDIHIDEFFRDAAIALDRLYLAFPRPLTLFVEDISGPAKTDEFGLPDDRYLGCLAALLWLAEEGYLRYGDTIRQQAIDQAVLTGRCFNVLTMPADDAAAGAASELPESVRSQLCSHIGVLRSALQSGSSTQIRATVLRIMDLMTR